MKVRGVGSDFRGEGERVQDVPVHTSVEGVVSNTHTFESSTLAPSSRPTTMTTATTTWLIPWKWYSSIPIDTPT